MPDNGTSPEKRLKSFQSFVVSNARITFLIPFALDIDSPKDCPGELELFVSAHDTDQLPILTFGDLPLTAEKTIHLDQFESIPVWASWRRF
jgi:hypothetical protein